MLCLFYLGLGVAYYLFIIYYLLFINRESSSCFALTFLFMVTQYCVGGIFRSLQKQFWAIEPAWCALQLLPTAVSLSPCAVLKSPPRMVFGVFPV